MDVSRKSSLSSSKYLSIDPPESNVPTWRRRANPPSPLLSPDRAPFSPVNDKPSNLLRRGSSRRSTKGPLNMQEQETTTFVSDKAQGQTYSKDSFKPGTILRAPLHEQNWNTPDQLASSPEDKSMTYSRYGPIHTKVRKMIVISTFEDHYVALPCFSHQGRGLERKAKPEEYVGIRDHRHTTAKEFQALSKHTPLVTGNLTDITEPIHPSTLVRLTYPVSRPYPSQCILEGQLSQESLGRLVKLYVKYGLRLPTL